MKKILFRTFTLILVVSTLAALSFAFVACNPPKGETFGQDTYFALDKNNTKYGGDSISAILSLAELTFMNSDETYFLFRQDGTVHWQITTKSGLFEGLGAILESFNIDLDRMFSGVDLENEINTNVEPLFPGFMARLEDADIEGALALAESIGIKICGINYDDEGVQAIEQYIAENKRIPADLLSNFPTDTVVQVVFDWEYRLEDLVGEDGTEYKAVYIGKEVASRDKQTQPFVIFTMTTDENGVVRLSFRNDMINFELGLVQMVAAAEEA